MFVFWLFASVRNIQDESIYKYKGFIFTRAFRDFRLIGWYQSLGPLLRQLFVSEKDVEVKSLSSWVGGNREEKGGARLLLPSSRAHSQTVKIFKWPCLLKFPDGFSRKQTLPIQTMTLYLLSVCLSIF